MQANRCRGGRDVTRVTVLIHVGVFAAFTRCIPRVNTLRGAIFVPVGIGGACRQRMGTRTHNGYRGWGFQSRLWYRVAGPLHCTVNLARPILTVPPLPALWGHGKASQRQHCARLRCSRRRIQGARGAPAGLLWMCCPLLRGMPGGPTVPNAKLACPVPVRPSGKRAQHTVGAPFGG